MNQLTIAEMIDAYDPALSPPSARFVQIDDHGFGLTASRHARQPGTELTQLVNGSSGLVSRNGAGMIAVFLTLAMIGAAFACAGARVRLEELERAQRFERRMRMEAWLDHRLSLRKAQRHVRSERAKRGWNTRRAG